MSPALHRAIDPAGLQLQPIDDDARNGGFQLVFGAGQYAIARWRHGRWTFANGHQLHFDPEGYRP
jgi:hypothetical protein